MSFAWRFLYSVLSAGALLGLCGRALSQPCVASQSTWQSKPFPATGMYLRASFDATPDGSMINGVTGLSLGDPSSAASLAAAVRFNESGFIDVLDGDAYRTDAFVRYEAGATYRIIFKLDMVGHRYSVTVVTPGRLRVLASNYSFPAGQRSLTRLDRWSVRSTAGSYRVCGFTVVDGLGGPSGE
jgi:hypothetical protein